jgi:hypothetical protein
MGVFPFIFSFWFASGFYRSIISVKRSGPSPPLEVNATAFMLLIYGQGPQGFF